MTALRAAMHAVAAPLARVAPRYFEVDEVAGRLLKHATEGDKEKVLAAANARWGTPRHIAMHGNQPIDIWRSDLALSLRAGAGALGKLKFLMAASVTLPQRLVLGQFGDIRSAEELTETFLSTARARIQRGDDSQEALTSTTKDVLDGVPTGYRRKVLERILDREEAEDPALAANRDQRREQGWAAMTRGKRPKTR